MKSVFEVYQMMNLHIDWSSVPDVINKDHFFGICHISKSTALHSLKSYKVSVSGKARKHNATKSRKRMCGRILKSEPFIKSFIMHTADGTTIIM